MTEEEWATSGKLHALLNYLAERASDRKSRLFGIACCREHIDFITDSRTRMALDVADQYVDGQVDEERRAAVETPVLDVYEAELEQEEDGRLHSGAVLALIAKLPYTTASAAQCVTAIGSCVEYNFYQVFSGLSNEVSGEVEYELTDLLRDIFGNSFRPVSFDPNWRTSTVVALAEGVYADRAFAPMPVLADALEDAGCDQPDILTHSRGPGPHARGCWAVDLILGKS